MISVPSDKDGAQIHAISANTTVFNQEEVECVDELWEEYLTQGSPDLLTFGIFRLFVE